MARSEQILAHLGAVEIAKLTGQVDGTGRNTQEVAMEIVPVTDPSRLAPEDQKFCEATKAWFNIDFVPRMTRVLLTVPEFGRPYGRASRRAMTDGALTRAQKELIATMVSAINVCEY